jgi:hypothetical protein
MIFSKAIADVMAGVTQQQPSAAGRTEQEPLTQAFDWRS